MRKKVVFGIVITLALSAGMFWYFYTEKISATISNAIQVVPEEASVIIESKRINKLWDKISQTNIIWEELCGISAVAEINKQITSLDSLIESNKTILELLGNQSAFISFVKTDKVNFDLLFSCNLPDLTYQESVDDFFKNANAGKEIIFDKHNEEKIGHVQLQGFYFTCLNGIIVISKNKNLVIRAINQLHSGQSIVSNPNFKKIVQSAGKNVDASIFINYQNLSDAVVNYLKDEFQPKKTVLSGFASFSGWDFTIKPNALSASGFTFSGDSSNNYLSVFNSQTPKKMEVYKILPSKTAFFFVQGISNINTFYTNLKKSRAVSNTSYFDGLNSNYDIAVEEEILSCVDEEIALAVVESSSDSLKNMFAVFHSSSIAAAQKKLNSIQRIVSQKEDLKLDTLNYKTHTISQLSLPNILENMFGQEYGVIKNNFYTTIYNYIVFANSKEELKYFIDEFEGNKTLANDKNYKTFSENIANESNIYIYSALSKSANLYPSFLNSALQHDFLKNFKTLKKIEAFSIQFSSNNNGLFYSNIYLKYNPEFKKETETLWELPLDTTFSNKPYVVLNHNTKAKEILIQDDANKIYLISNTGKILWTKQLSEKIMGDVIQLDVYKNDKLQMVFNTRSYIYMYDRNGNEMKGFPLKLKSPATNTVSVIDYENNKEYRIFIATENKRVVCYKPNGEQVTAFGFDKTENPVYLPVYFFNTASKDHICFVDVKGKIYIVNRQGEARIKLKDNLPQGIRNYFLDIGKDYSKSSIVAADTMGAVVRISLTGDKEVYKLQDFETSPFFEFRDLNNDKIKEFVMLSRNELKVFNQDKSLMFKYDFNEKISLPPMIFVFKDGGAKIGVVSDKTNELFLFNENGSLYSQFPLSGNTIFSVSDLNNQNTYNLITGNASRAIYAYQLQ
jgi:hypothetical protein